jgi:integrase/recombinase XerD
MNTTYNVELSSKPGRDGRHSILLRVTVNRKHRRVKTGYFVKASEFNKKAKHGFWVRTANADHKYINENLVELIRQASVEGLGLEKPVPDQESSKPLITLKSFADRMVNEANTDSVGYQRNLKSRLSVFVAFAGADLPLASVDLALLNRFKQHLQQEKKMPGTQHTYFNRIKRMMLVALKYDLIDKDPFRHFEMPNDKPAPRLKLSDEQVRALESVETAEQRTDSLGRTYGPSIWLHRAKWLYLFAYHMGGLRSRDVLQLRWSNLVGEPGKERLEYQMSKTGEQMSTKLNAKGRAIVDLFRTPDQTENGYIFGVLSNEAPYFTYLTHEEKRKMPRDLLVKLFNDISSAQTQINGELKVLAKKAGITERLTFHTARHSFADRARRKMKESKNISIDDIRQALGHQRLDTTQRYLNSFDKEGLDSAMDAIFD